MNIENLLVLTLILIFLWVAFWAFACIPFIKINNSLKKVIKGIEKGKKEGKIIENLTDSKIKLFSEKKLQDAWNSYCKRVEDLNGDSKVVDLNYYFSPENFIWKNTNRDISNILPMMFFVVSVILTILFTIIYQINIEAAVKELLLVISGSLFLSLFSFASHKILIRKSGTNLIRFIEILSNETGSSISSSEQLSSIRFLLEKYNKSQLLLYNNLDKAVTNAVIKRVESFNSNIYKLIENYLSAISSDQQSAMENLADYFIKNTSLLYDGQFDKIKETISEMTELQEKTSKSFESISKFYENTQIAIESVKKNSVEMSDYYQTYFDQMKDFSMGIESNINLMGKMLMYIDENNKMKHFTVEQLTNLQKESLEISENSIKHVNQFTIDFKDHYSSYIVALKSASSEMVKTGEFLKESYTGLIENINSETDKVFSNFEQRISEISIRFADSIEELQQTVEEIPIMLKKIKD